VHEVGEVMMSDALKHLASAMDKLEAMGFDRQLLDERAKSVAAEYGVKLRSTFCGYEFSGTSYSVERFKAKLRTVVRGKEIGP
jgi:hypothetical protein